jgi:hypothetical protein
MLAIRQRFRLEETNQAKLMSVGGHITNNLLPNTPNRSVTDPV